MSIQYFAGCNDSMILIFSISSNSDSYLLELSGTVKSASITADLTQSRNNDSHEQSDDTDDYEHFDKGERPPMKSMRI
jgi:hypothetical protein